MISRSESEPITIETSGFISGLLPSKSSISLPSEYVQSQRPNRCFQRDGSVQFLFGMQTQRLSANDEGSIEHAAGIIRAGGLVAFPTETVYGLGANALDAAAVKRIFMAKERPAWDPMIVHVNSLEMLASVAAKLPALFDDLFAAFMPEPLTLVLPKSATIPDAVTAGRNTVAVRFPAHPVAQRLIASTELPIAAPSANRFGRVSPTAAEHVLADLDGRIDAVVDAGPCDIGVESAALRVPPVAGNSFGHICSSFLVVPPFAGQR